MRDGPRGNRDSLGQPGRVFCHASPRGVSSLQPQVSPSTAAANLALRHVELPKPQDVLYLINIYIYIYI